MDKRAAYMTMTTSSWLNITLHVYSFLEENGEECEVESCSSAHLNNMMDKCYLGMRRKDGGYHQEPGYLGFGTAMWHELNIHDLQFNIYQDPEFQQSNDILDGVLNLRRREGDTKPVLHKELILEDDMEKIWYFCNTKKMLKISPVMCGYPITDLSLCGCEVQEKRL